MNISDLPNGVTMGDEFYNDRESVRDDSLITGWISPSGEFFGCDYRDHIPLAYELGFQEIDLEYQGFVKISKNIFHDSNPELKGFSDEDYFYISPNGYNELQIQKLIEKGFEPERVRFHARD